MADYRAESNVLSLSDQCSCGVASTVVNLCFGHFIKSDGNLNKCLSCGRCPKISQDKEREELTVYI